MSRLLITGAAGFVGARVVRLAIERGHDVVAAAGPFSPLDRLADLHEEVPVLRADVADGVALERMVAAARPEACIHLAAAGAVMASHDPALLIAANAAAPARLVGALSRAGGARLVTVGSSSEYGPCERPMEESQPARPDDAYGVTKLAGGLLARAIGMAHGVESVHARLFSVYGPGEDRRRLVASLLDALLAREPIALSPGGQVRDFVYVDDVAEALLRAALLPGLDGATVNVGSGVETTVRELCLTAAELTGGGELLRFGERAYRDVERFHWQASTRLAERLLGWRAATPLRTGLDLTIAAAAQASRRSSGSPSTTIVPANPIGPRSWATISSR